MIYRDGFKIDGVEAAINTPGVYKMPPNSVAEIEKADGSLRTIRSGDEGGVFAVQRDGKPVLLRGCYIE